MDTDKLFKAFKIKLQQRREYLTEDSLRYYFFACMYEQDKSLDNYIMELPYASLEDNEDNKYHINLTSKDLEGLIKKDGSKSKSHDPHQELDLYYSDKKEDTLCVEFKFHRNPLVNSDYAHTNAAGSLINDIRRLQLIKAKTGFEVRRLFVYVTDNEMHSYCINKSNNKRNKDYRDLLKSFYKSEINKPMSFTFDTSKIYIPNTFLISAKESFAEPQTAAFTINVKKLFDEGFKTTCPSFKETKCYIKIYEIQT